jgi:hypothetical protein
MRKLLPVTIMLALGAWAFPEAGHRTQAAEPEDAMLVHDVYFALKDNSAEARKKFVDLCKKYLTKHEGALHFGVGPVVELRKRPPEADHFDIGLHIVFKNKEAHDKYQVSDRHKEFMKEIKDSLKKVEVFDSYVEK